MKNSKESFAYSLLLLCLTLLSSCAIGKNNIVSSPLLTINYSNNSKTHSRAITATDKELIIAASDGTVYFYPKQTKSIYSMFINPDKEYRDIIFAENKVIIMAIGDSSETTSYKLEKSDKLFKTPYDGVFLDGMDFYGNTVFMMGDPVNNKFSLYTSQNWGETWEAIKNSPFAYPGEAGFAASGTNVSMFGPNEFMFVSGGDSSRFFLSHDAGENWRIKSMGFNSCPTCGAYSFTQFKKGHIVAVGGDYLKPEDGAGSCRISKDWGKTWKSPKVNPNGYRSNITTIDGILYCCGTNGIDYSKNKGKTWIPFAIGDYYTLCKFDGKLAASTTNGRIHLFKLK